MMQEIHPEQSPAMKEQCDRLYHALLSANRVAVDEIIQTTSQTLTPLQCAEHLLVPCLQQIGDQWDQGTVALSQLYMTGRICEQVIDQLFSVDSSPRKSQPRIGIAVLADHHVLGKRIIDTVLRSAGYNLFDYGAGIGPEELAQCAIADKIEVLMVSSLMLPSALQVKNLRQHLVGHPIKVYVGGAPFLFDPHLWKEVGADGMGRNAADALRLLEKYVESVS